MTTIAKTTRKLRSRLTPARVLAAGAALALSLTACGSSSSPATSSAPAAANGAPTSSGPSAAASSTAGGSSPAATTGAAATSAATAAPVKTTVLLDWFPNPDHASLYTALTQGDFTRAGVEVTLQAPSGSQDALKLVSAGAMPLGISYEPNVITAASKGLDVEAVAALVPVPLDSLIISGGSGITSPAGLAGKKIGTTGDPVANAILSTILSKNGVDVKQTKLIAVSEGLIAAMLTENVDAIIGGYRNVEAIQLQLKGKPGKVFPVDEQGVPDYDELVVVAQKSKLANDPAYQAMVKAFLSGLAKGDAAAQADPNAAIAALKPQIKVGDYSDADLKAMVPVTTKLFKNPDGFGSMSAGKWQAFADWMLKNKLIDKAVTASDAESSAYLPAK